MITEGMLLIVGSGGLATPIGLGMILGGAALCFNAAGANSPEDLTKPEILLEGGLSITLAMVGVGDLNIAKDLLKISKITTNEPMGKIIVETSIDITNYNSLKGIASNYIDGKMRSWVIEGSCNFLDDGV